MHPFLTCAPQEKGQFMPDAISIPAAQYLRMSTEHQKYSLANQTAAIGEFASAHGFHIVQTYHDAGRSGVVLKRREGLKALLKDVIAKPSYKAILVYDVSRWGRFQDVDESAHYEFICKSSGVPVVYCAEQFENDGSLGSVMVKSLRRAMAAEFSRDLGEKVIRGTKRLVEMGYMMGGVAPFGFRRMLLREDGSPKQILHRGQQKHLSSDRVTLVLGPRREIRLVRLIFHLALEKGMRAHAIANLLNGLGLSRSRRTPWTRCNVQKLLTNPRYKGDNFWARRTSRLGGPVRLQPETLWTVKPGAFPRIVSKNIYDRVQFFLHSWTWSDELILDALREVWRNEGKVTQALLCRLPYAPSHSTCVHHFGSFQRALALIGYRPQRNNELARRRSVSVQKLHRSIVEKITAMFPKRVTILRRSRSPKLSLLLDKQHQINVILAPSTFTAPMRDGWIIWPRPQERGSPALCCFLEEDFRTIHQMYFTTKVPISPIRLTVREHGAWFMQNERVESLSCFCQVASRCMGKVAASSPGGQP